MRGKGREGQEIETMESKEMLMHIVLKTKISNAGIGKRGDFLIQKKKVKIIPPGEMAQVNEIQHE